MKKTKKAFLVVLSVILVMSTLVVGTYAALPSGEVVSPLWTSIYDVELFLDFNGTTCMPGLITTKQSTATSIEATLTVYEEVDNEWVEVDSWYGSSTRGTLLLGEDFAATSGVRYKAVANVTAYTGNAPESETFELIKTCP